MVKLIFLCRRRPEITHERYGELLLGGHVPLALRHHPTLVGYIVNIVAPPADIDSIGELYFDSLEDFHRRLYDSPEGRRIVEADVAGFMRGADAFVVEEDVVRRRPVPHPLGQRTPGVKLVTCVARHPAMSRADFAGHWRAPGGAHVPAGAAHLRGHARNIVVEQLGTASPAWDGFEVRFLPAAPGDHRNADEADPLLVRAATTYAVAEYVQKEPPPRV